MYPWIIKCGGRRFLMIMAGCFIFTALLVGGWLDQATYALLVGGFTSGYLGASGFQKYTQSKQPEPIE